MCPTKCQRERGSRDVGTQGKSTYVMGEGSIPGGKKGRRQEAGWRRCCSQEREPQAPLPNPTVQCATLRVRAPGQAPTLRKGARCARAPTPAPGTKSSRLAQRAWPSRPCLEETLNPGMPCLMGRPDSLGPPVRMESLRTWFGVKALGHQRQPTRRPGSTTFHRERGPQGSVGVVTH